MINSRRGGTALVVLPEEAVVPDSKFLTPDEVAERYRGGISVGTLRNWRAMRLGPSFVKIGNAVLYPLDELDTWDEKTKVQSRASQGLGEHRGDRACWSRSGVLNRPHSPHPVLFNLPIYCIKTTDK